MWTPPSAADASENDNAASTPAPPQHLHVDNSTPASSQSLSPRHSSYALRRLSEEREKNKLLTQQLRQKQQTSPMRNDTYLNHIKELQRELQMETQRRIEAELRAGKSFMYDVDEADELDEEKVYSSKNLGTSASPLLVQNSNQPQPQLQVDRIQYNSSLKHLIQRAHHLLGVNNSQTHNTQQKLLTYQEATTTNELMKEFQSLLEAFYIEQRQNDASKDVIWLFEELEWRFEEIKRGYEEERLTWESKANNVRSSMNEAERFNADMSQWKACLKDLVDAVQSQIVDGAHTTANNIQHDEMLAVQQQLSSTNLIHEQKCLDLNQEMEALKRTHQETNDEMSKTIHKLQLQVNEQYTIISQLRHEKELQDKVLREERQHFHVNYESMAARVRYLEEIVRSSNKLLTSPTARTICTQPVLKLDSDDQNTPVNNTVQQPTSSQLSDTPNFASAPVLNYFENSTIRTNESLIHSLRQHIEELGIALEESEEERAKAIEQFQIERDGHIRQYEELSSYVRQLLDSDAAVCNGNDHV